MKMSKSLKLPVRGAPDQSVQRRTTQTILKLASLLVLAVVAVLFPQHLSPDVATTTVAVTALMFAAWATAWNIFSGYTGYIALGHAAFFGSGAYALAIVCQDWHVTNDYGPLLLLPLCGLIVAVI